MMVVVMEIGRELWDGAQEHVTVIAVSCAVFGLLAGVMLAGKFASDRRAKNERKTGGSDD